MVEAVIGLLSGPEEIVEQAEPIRVSEHGCRRGQLAKAGGQIAVHPGEVVVAVLLLTPGNGNSDVFVLDKIVAERSPVHQEPVLFVPVLVQAVAPVLHQHCALEVHRIQPMIDNRDLAAGIRRQTVDNSAVALEDSLLIRVGGRSVVDVGKAPGTAVLAAYQPGAVRVNPFNRNGLLDGFRNAERDLFRFVRRGKGLNQSRHAPSCPRQNNGRFRCESLCCCRRGS